MKKYLICNVLTCLCVLVLFGATAFAAPTPTPSGTEPTKTLTPLEEKPDNTGLVVAISIVAVLSMATGATLSFFVTRYFDRRKFTDDYAWEHHDELCDQIVEREADKRIAVAKAERDKERKANAKKKKKEKPEKSEKAAKKTKTKKSKSSKADDEFESPFVQDILSRQNDVQDMKEEDVRPIRMNKKKAPIKPQKYDTDGCILLPDGKKMLRNGELLPDPELDENGNSVIWQGRALYYDGPEPFYVTDGEKHYYYEEKQ